MCARAAHPDAKEANSLLLQRNRWLNYLTRLGITTPGLGWRNPLVPRARPSSGGPFFVPGCRAAHPKESSVTTHALNLASPGELIAVVPFLLGFHPRRSVVLMALRQRRLTLTQRLDLPDPGTELEAAIAMVRPLLRDQPDSALIIGYEDDPGQSRPLIDRVSVLLAENHISVVDRIVVHEGRWRSLDCANPHCCPPDGTQVPEPADVP